MPKIESLSQMPNPAFYRRKNGETFLKINERFHVKAKVVRRKAEDSGEELVLMGDGIAEKFNPREEVEVIDWMPK